MLRRRLTLLLAILLLPAAPAAAEAHGPPRPPRQEVQQDDGFHAKVARASAGVEMAERDRPRENGPRGFGGRATTSRSNSAGIPAVTVARIVPAVVPPVPALAERLPYYPTAPPALS